MRLLVTGGRQFRNERALRSALDRLKPDVLIHGGAYQGADWYAHLWTRDNDYGLLVIVEPVTPQEWDQFGGIAGHMRNARMIAKWKPDLVLATRGGNGTENCIELALRAGIPVLELRT